MRPRGAMGLLARTANVVAIAGWIVVSFNALAEAACLRNVADQPGRWWRAAFTPTAVPPAHVSLTYIGHSTFLIETPAGVRIATDYSDYARPSVIPDIVTMNNAHPSHYTDHPDAAVRYVLRGWDAPDAPANHSLSYLDVHVRNVSTNLREYGGTRYNRNSIFVFEVSGLCIAHLGHLHHRLTPEHLGRLGEIDVLLVPVDGAYTLNLEQMVEVIDQLRAPLVIPMHYFTTGGLERFLSRLQARTDGVAYAVSFSDTPQILLSRATLPVQPEIRVLPGR